MPSSTLISCASRLTPFSFQDELAATQKEVKAVRKMSDEVGRVVYQLAQAQVTQLRMMERLSAQVESISAQVSKLREYEHM